MTRYAPRVRMARAILPLLVTALFACGEGDDRAAPVAAAAAAERPAARESKRSAPRRRDERPLPAFDGRTLDGEPLAVSSLLGKRLLLFFFDPSAPESEPAAKAVRNIKGLRGEHNFEIVGVAMGSSRDRSRAFVDSHRFDFVVFDDSGGSIARTLGLRAPVALVGVDAEGYLTFARGGVPIDASDPTSIIEAGIREALRLPVTRGAMEPVLGERPLAPNFKAVRLDGDETFELASLRGTPSSCTPAPTVTARCAPSGRPSPRFPRTRAPSSSAYRCRTGPPRYGPSSRVTGSTSSPCSSTRTRRFAPPTAGSPGSR